MRCISPRPLSVSPEKRTRLERVMERMLGVGRWGCRVRVCLDGVGRCWGLLEGSDGVKVSWLGGLTVGGFRSRVGEGVFRGRWDIDWMDIAIPTDVWY